jgi:hypothetical protein
METERMELSAREWERLKVLQQVEEGHVKQVEAAQGHHAHRRLEPGHRLEQILSVRMARTVGGDHTVVPTGTAGACGTKMSAPKVNTEQSTRAVARPASLRHQSGVKQAHDSQEEVGERLALCRWRPRLFLLLFERSNLGGTAANRASFIEKEYL